ARSRVCDQYRESLSDHDAYESSSSSTRVDCRPPDNSCWRRSRSVCGVLYFSSRATLVCFAFARPRPIDLTPSETVLGDLGGAHRKCEYVPEHRIACPARIVRPGVEGPVTSGGFPAPERLGGWGVDAGALMQVPGGSRRA